MTLAELEAIRARDATGIVFPNGDIATPAGLLHAGRAGNVEWRDRRTLLRAYKALVEAAGKVKCRACGGTGRVFYTFDPCPDCSDLREQLRP